MSFLDEQATGQIGIGEKASLGTLTRTRRKRRKGQRPQGTETYSLLPQNEFTDIVSSPTDITQVGIGQLLTAQGIPAAQVRNVFERYQDTGAAPIGDVGDVLYPQPEDDGDDDNDDDDIETQTDPYIPDPGDPTNPGFTTDDGQVGTGDKNFESAAAMLGSVGGAISRGVGNTAQSLATSIQNAKDAFNVATGGFARSIGRAEARANDPNAVATSGRGTINVTPAAQGSSPFALFSDPSVVDAQAAATAEANATAQAEAAAAALFGGNVSFNAPGGNEGGDGGATGSGGGDAAAPGSTPDDGYGIFASGGTVTKSKSKNKNSFMSMKGK